MVTPSFRASIPFGKRRVRWASAGVATKAMLIAKPTRAVPKLWNI
jgi:hypothetical protein